MKTRAIRTIFAACAFVLASAPVAATAQTRPPRPVDRGNVERRVRVRFGEMVKSELKLSDEQLAKVEQVMASFEERRRGLIQREAALRRRVRPAGAEPSNDEAERLLKEMVAVREEETRLFKSEMDELRKTLTPAQALRFYELRAELMDRVQRLRQPGGARGAPGAGGRPGVPAPGGGPPPAF